MTTITLTARNHQHLQALGNKSEFLSAKSFTNIRNTFITSRKFNMKFTETQMGGSVFQAKLRQVLALACLQQQDAIHRWKSVSVHGICRQQLTRREGKDSLRKNLQADVARTRRRSAAGVRGRAGRGDKIFDSGFRALRQTLSA